MHFIINWNIICHTFSDKEVLEDLDNDEKIVPTSKAPKSKKDRKKKKEEELEEAQRELERMNIGEENLDAATVSNKDTSEHLTENYIAEQNNKGSEQSKPKPKDKKQNKKVVVIF